MAQQALTAGRTQTRGRALFGLLDRDGWGWASIKAVFWFILIIFLLGYLPDRAYYFTVNRTMDLGILAWSPINFCPPTNESLPCPPPVGAAVPWEVAPPEISLPAPRVDGSVAQSGTKVLFIGGSDGNAPTDSTFVATVSGPGNFDKWTDGPKLPEARADAAATFSGGSIFLAGGYGPDGKPTDSVYVITTSGQTGQLGEWQTAEEAGLKELAPLPKPIAGAALVAAPDGLLLIGGTSDGKAPVKTVWKSQFDKTGKLQKWVQQPDLYTAVFDQSAAIVGDYLWVYGGTSPDGPTKTVQRGEFGTGSQATTLQRFGVAGGNVDLPEPRTNAAGFAASGALYVVGGSDGTSPQTEMWWAVPDRNGNILEWKHLAQSDLPESSGGIAGPASLVLGPDAILIGGENADGPVAGAARANLAPQAPFFQLGLVGATVPALKIDGEIGQQLGYLAANTVGIVNFAILLLVGWAFAHPAKVGAFRDWIRRRRAAR
ncbi:MAG: Kelch repeat-containing protein [Chloroflexota bacterium]